MSEDKPLLTLPPTTDPGGETMQPALPKSSAAEWTVACKKLPKFTRWPELLSACWMALILFGISFLVFHALSLGCFKRPQHSTTYEETKPASNVYYHQIIPKRSQVPLSIYSDYISLMAKKYPLLKFNIIFLIDDGKSMDTRKRTFPAYVPWVPDYKLDDAANESYEELKRKHRNVIVTLMSLNKFMSQTPVKNKWRYIPLWHLSFYARVFSVWQNGGIGMDLSTFNNNYHQGNLPDARIDSVMKQHNDGINPEVYARDLNKIYQDEANALFGMFSAMISQLLSDTRNFFNRDLPVLSRHHRSKRQIQKSSEMMKVIDVSKDPGDVKENDDNAQDVGLNIPVKDFVNITEALDDKSNKTVKEPLKTMNFTESAASKNASNKVILFYDVSILSNDFAGPLGSLREIGKKSKCQVLSIDSEGTFIAASSKYHPLLEHLITTVGMFGMHPKFAIQDAYLSHCSGVFRNDLYCNNIFVL